jgi:hypothetical protein
MMYKPTLRTSRSWSLERSVVGELEDLLHRYTNIYYSTVPCDLYSAYFLQDRDSLCFSCGLPGHQARNCRKKCQGYNDKRQTDGTVRMVRSGYATRPDQEQSNPENDKARRQRE